MPTLSCNINGFGAQSYLVFEGFDLPLSSNRQQNLSLLQTYGSNAWRIQNHLLEATAKHTEKALEESKELTVEINRDRKNMQVCLETELVSKCCLICMSGTVWKAADCLGDSVDRTHIQCPSDRDG